MRIAYRGMAVALTVALTGGCAGQRATVVQWTQSLPSRVQLPRPTPPPAIPAVETHALVLREFEFDARKPHLNARGEDHLLAISSVLSESELAVWVEPLTEVDASIDAVELTALNDARRQGVVQQLLARGIVDAEQRVQVGLPDSP